MPVIDFGDTLYLESDLFLILVQVHSEPSHQKNTTMKKKGTDSCDGALRWAEAVVLPNHLTIKSPLQGDLYLIARLCVK